MFTYERYGEVPHVLARTHVDGVVTQDELEGYIHILDCTLYSCVYVRGGTFIGAYEPLLGRHILLAVN